MTIRVVPDTYATIAAAYAAAANGDTIYIKESGSPYTEYLDVYHKYNLIFQGESKAVEWKAPSGNHVLSGDGASEIKDLWLQGSTNHLLLPYSGPGFNVHDCKLTGGSLDHYINYGANIAGGMSFKDCDIYGLYNYGLQTGTISATTEILRNHFHTGGKYANIRTSVVNDGGNLKVEDNIIDAIGTSAYLGWGISVEGSVAAGGVCSIKGNTITGTELGAGNGAGYGIRFVGSNSGVKTITENIVKGWFAQYPIYLGSGCTGLTSYWNDFYGGQQTKQGYDYAGSNTWDNGVDKGNYWGYGGAAYDTDGDAIGDVPYELDKNSLTPQDNYPLMCSITEHPDCPYLALKKKWCLGRVGVRFVKL